MKFVDNLRQKPFVQKVEKFFPAIAFLGGFGWDSITLGRQIDNTDLLFLLAYYTGAFILVILLSAHLEHPEGWTANALWRRRHQRAVTPRRNPRLRKRQHLQSLRRNPLRQVNPQCRRLRPRPRRTRNLLPWRGRWRISRSLRRLWWPRKSRTWPMLLRQRSRTPPMLRPPRQRN